MEKKYQSTSSIVFDISALMTAYGLAAVDVVDAIMLVKSRKTDLDEDAVFSKTLNAGVSLVESYTVGTTTYPFVLIVDFEVTDYGVGLLEANKAYFMGVGIKRATDVCYLEGNQSDEKLKITPDLIRC